VQLVTYVLLALSIIYFLLPWKSILECVASEDFKTNDKRISDVYHQEFEEDNYVDKNPIFKEFKFNKQEKDSLIGRYTPKRR
jgi:hypothetical protein